jgi:hypothetical protein
LAATLASLIVPWATATILGSCTAALSTGLIVELAFRSTFRVDFVFDFASRSGIPEPFP